MPLQEIVQVDISLQTSAVTQAGFGTILFITDEQKFLERVRSYNDINAVAEDFEPTDKAFLAAQAAFSQSPSPTIFKVGRQGDTTSTLTPEDVAEDTVYNVTVTVNDNDSVTATYTALLADTAEEIAIDLAGQINGDANVADHVTASVVGTGATAVLEISPNTSADSYFLSDEQNLTVEIVSVESPAQTILAISDIDNDYYFVTAHNKSQNFVLNMAEAIEVTQKIYFVAVQDEDAYATLADPATDTLGILAESNFFRSSGWYHHEADTRYPDTAFVAVASPSTPGTKVWGNNQIRGFGASRNAGGGKLTFTQRSNLNDRNSNWVETLGGVDITTPGKVAGNEWIDIIRDRDYYVARLTEAYQQKFINSPKIPYTDSGINELRSVFNTVSDRLVTTPTQPNVLQEENPYSSNFPKAAEVPLADKQMRILRATFVAFLAGAIQNLELQGVLTFEQQA